MAQSNLIVFLDMDNTLIFSKKSPEKLAKDCQKSEILVQAPVADDGGYVTVFKRPSVDHFLQQVSKNYAEVHLFTAAGQDWADWILNKLDPTGTVFTKRWYRDSCKERSERDIINYPHKDIFALDISPALDPKRVVFVDDTICATLPDPSNTIAISKFYGDKDDKALPKVLEVLKELDKHEDVRPRLNQCFGWDLIKKMHMQSFGMLVAPNPIR